VAAGGVGHLVEVRRQDALACADLSAATVFYLYLLNTGLVAVAPLLAAGARPGARVASYQFALPGWEGWLVETRSATSGRPGRPDVSAFSKLHISRLPGGDDDSGGGGGATAAGSGVAAAGGVDAADRGAG
jgi:hypothetical protein